jgi:hypothetical protein
MSSAVLPESILQKIREHGSFNLFGKGFLDKLHWGRLFIFLFDTLYSVYEVDHKINVEGLVEKVIEKYALPPFQIIRSEQSSAEDIFEINDEFSEVLLIIKNGLFLVVFARKAEIYYGPEITDDEKTELLCLVNEFLCYEDVKNRVFMVQRLQSGFELVNFRVHATETDLELIYNKDFKAVNEIICHSLNTKNKNGIILLHGKQGTGKTYYLRHLINTIERKFIFFPLHMLESINSPDFLPFISEHPNAILILEDCENLLKHRESGMGNTSVLSNLLNIGDGLLSDALKINVICTFNAPLSHIDHALLRKGRLLARYEFKELEIQKAQYLALKLGKLNAINHPMTLSEIFNLDQESFESPQKKRIGFIAGYHTT